VDYFVMYVARGAGIEGYSIVHADDVAARLAELKAIAAQGERRGRVVKLPVR